MRPFLVIAFAFLLASLPVHSRAADDWVVRPSAQSVAETVARLEEAITRSGSTVLAVFDHQAAAAAVGHSIAGATVVLFAKPKASTPLIEANPRAAIDMPQRILVWEEEGATYAGFVSPTALVSRHGFDPAHPELRRLRAAMDSLVATATKRLDARMIEASR